MQTTANPYVELAGIIRDNPVRKFCVTVVVVLATPVKPALAAIVQPFALEMAPGEPVIAEVLYQSWAVFAPLIPVIPAMSVIWTGAALLLTKLKVTRELPLLLTKPVVETVVCALADSDISELAKTVVNKRKIFFIRRLCLVKRMMIN